jgi:hypothetical protein
MPGNPVLADGAELVNINPALDEDGRHYDKSGRQADAD